MYIMIIPLLFILTIHFKTDNVKEISIAWGVIYSIPFFLMEGGWFFAPFIGLVAFVVAYSVFSLANYFEESIFLRTMVLVFGMIALLKAPSFLMGIVLVVINNLFA